MNTLAFMFETCFIFKLSQNSKDLIKRDDNYYKCWQGLNRHFDSKAAE